MTTGSKEGKNRVEAIALFVCYREDPELAKYNSPEVFRAGQRVPNTSIGLEVWDTERPHNYP